MSHALTLVRPLGGLTVTAELAAAAVVGALVALAGLAAVARLSRSGGALEQSIAIRARRPLLVLLPLLAMEVARSSFPPGSASLGIVPHVLTLLLIATVATLVVRLTYVVEDVVLPRLTGVGADNLRARRALTQIQVFRKVTVAGVILVALAVGLLTFSDVRALGATLLASAGVVGLVVGIAARPAATNVVAGFQLAITQPIRLDDVVVVEGEWGRIEEIALTYVIVRIWDQRALVVPIGYFAQTAFQNWTRTSADLLAHTVLYADFTLPVEQLRVQFREELRATPLWDGRVATLQVTEAGPTSMQLRLLASVRSAGDSWDLRCLLRERLLSWLVREHPECLPRTRWEGTGPQDPPAGQQPSHLDGLRPRPADPTEVRPGT